MLKASVPRSVGRVQTEDERESQLSDVVELRRQIDELALTLERERQAREDLEAVLERTIWLLSQGRTEEAEYLFCDDSELALD